MSNTYFIVPSGVGGRVSARDCTDHTSEGGDQPARMRIRMQRPSSQQGAHSVLKFEEPQEKIEPVTKGDRPKNHIDQLHASTSLSDSLLRHS